MAAEPSSPSPPAAVTAADSSSSHAASPRPQPYDDDDDDDDDPRPCPPPGSDSDPTPGAGPRPWVARDVDHCLRISTCVCPPAEGLLPPPTTPPPPPDETLLDIFRTQLQPCCPYVIIDAHETAASLADARPFLMAAIRTVSSFRNLQRMRAQISRLVERVGEFSSSSSSAADSMDVLQGVLVVVSWHHHHCTVHLQVRNLLAVAGTLLDEMGLGSESLVRHRRTTWDEKRAVLGVWLVSSVMSTIIHKSQPMPFTPHMERYLREVGSAGDAPSDRTLAVLVKIQRLTERICAFDPAKHWLEESTAVQELQSGLDGIRGGLPDELATDCVVQMYLATARLHLYAPPIVEGPLAGSLCQAVTCHSVQGLLALKNLDASRDALEGWLRAGFAFPIESLDRQNCLVGAQFIYAVTMIGRWAKLTSEAGIEHCFQPLLSSSIMDEEDLPHDMQALQYSPLYGVHKMVRDPDGAADGGTTLGLTTSSTLSALGRRFERASRVHQRASSASQEEDIWGVAISKIRAAAALTLQEPRGGKAATAQTASQEEEGRCMSAGWASCGSSLDMQFPFAQMYAHLGAAPVFGLDC